MAAFAGYYQPVNVVSEQWHFLQRLTGGLHLRPWRNTIVLVPLLGPPDTLAWQGALLFTRRNERQASAVLGTEPSGARFLQAYTHQYYCKAKGATVLASLCFRAFSLRAPTLFYQLHSLAAFEGVANHIELGRKIIRQ